MEKRYTAKIGEQDVVISTGKLAGLAGGAVTVQIGETVVLVTATGSKQPREGIDFFPLSVDPCCALDRPPPAAVVPQGFPQRCAGRRDDDLVRRAQLSRHPGDHRR